MQFFPTVDEDVQYFRSEGYTGSINDMHYAALGDLGYSGALTDRLRAYLLDEFGSYYEAMRDLRNGTSVFALLSYKVLNLEPPLVLDFDATYYRTGGTATDLVSAATHTRASSATYVDANGILQTAAINEPRVGHHIWNGSAWVDEGYLHESEARTNLVTYSSDFENVSYGGVSANITPGYANSPIGANTATRLIDDGLTGTGAVGWADAATTVANSSVYTFWALLKADQLSWAYLEARSFTTPGNVQTYFDLGNGVIGTVGTGHTPHMTSWGDGWYLCGITFTTDTADTSGQPRVYVAESDATISVERDGTSSILMAAWQFEQGSVPTSYIPTAGATVTRAADAMTIPAANLPWPEPVVIGEELVTNGTFDADTDWTKGSGMTISGGTLNFSGLSGNTTQAIVATSSRGKLLYVEYEITSITSGTIRTFTQQISPTVITRYTALESSLGVKSGFFLIPDNASNFGFNTSNFIGSIDNVSVREINPLAVSIQMEGTMTYADEGGTEVTWFDWRLNSLNYIQANLRTQSAATGEVYHIQAANGISDDVDGRSSQYSPGINVPFNIASRHGSTFINGAVDGTALTANLTPTALPYLENTDMQIGYDFNGTIKLVRVWADDLTDEGIEEASA